MQHIICYSGPLLVTKGTLQFGPNRRWYHADFFMESTRPYGNIKYG